MSLLMSRRSCLNLASSRHIFGGLDRFWDTALEKRRTNCLLCLGMLALSGDVSNNSFHTINFHSFCISVK